MRVGNGVGLVIIVFLRGVYGRYLISIGWFINNFRNIFMVKI